MNDLAKHRRNLLYSHTSSVEHRAAEEHPKEISPIGKLKLKHADALRALGGVHQREYKRMNDRHQQERNDDPVTRNGGSPAQETLNRERKEREALDDHQREERRAVTRHQAAEMETALRKHGAAP